MQIVTITKNLKDKAAETPKEENARATSGVLILSIRPMIRIHPELEMMSSPSTIKLTDIVLEIPITNYSAEIKLIGSSRPQPINTIQTPPPKPQVTQREGKCIAIKEAKEPTTKLVPASREVCQDPDEPIRVPYDIHGKIYQLTNDEIQAHLHKEEMIKMAAKELTRLKLEPISDVKIHPNKKPIVLIVYIRNDKINSDVHNPFKFVDFRVTELDELGLIIKKKKSRIVKELMIFVGKGYERMRKILKELGIYSALPTPAHEQASSQLLGRK
nr:hypothetical protein [Tanacetum cinerariifolium]